MRAKLYVLTLVPSAMALAFVAIRAKEALDLRAAAGQAQAINGIADRSLAEAPDLVVGARGRLTARRTWPSRANRILHGRHSQPATPLVDFVTVS